MPRNDGAAEVNRNLDNYETLRKTDRCASRHRTRFCISSGARAKTALRSESKISFRQSCCAAQYQSVEDLAFATVPQLAELIRTRKITAIELQPGCTSARLKRYGPKLLCVVTLTEELALSASSSRRCRNQARQVSRTTAWHSLGRKDLFATKGIKTTWGAEPYREQVIDYDATIVERLREAGAVLVAKLSMGALAQGPQVVRRCHTQSLGARRRA